MDFEILYEVFLPKYITLGENGLSAEAIQILEQEAIALALDEERHLPGGFPRGKVLCYDTHLKRYVPLENLKSVLHWVRILRRFIQTKLDIMLSTIN